MTIIIIFLAHWYLSLFFQTFFLHRYASHNLYSMHKIWERIFYLLTFLFQGSSFLHPAAYALMHRNHHRFADTNKDPHSPTIVNNIIDFNKNTLFEYRRLIKKFKNDDIKANDVPRWPFLENLGELWIIRLTFISIYITLYLIYSPSIWYYCLIPIHIFMGPIHGFIVNWFGHKIGYRNFNNTNDDSKNTLYIDFLMLGELYQNNHHKMPLKRNFAYRWFEIDFGFFIAYILTKLKIINLKTK